MDIRQEIAKHLEWIEAVSAMIGEDGLSPDKLEEISRHDRCALGAWLDSEQAGRCEPSTGLAQVRARHEKFHKLAGEMMAAIQRGDGAEAISIQQDFIQTSQSLVGGLIALQETNEQI